VQCNQSIRHFVVTPGTTIPFGRPERDPASQRRFLTARLRLRTICAVKPELAVAELLEGRLLYPDSA
jgi:hypothetical protein